jgi:hypothetical protein
LILSEDRDSASAAKPSLVHQSEGLLRRQACLRAAPIAFPDESRMPG